MDASQRRLAEELLFSEKKAASFAKQLFRGHFDAASLSPFPFPSAQTIAVTDALELKLSDTLDKELDPERIDKEASIPAKLIDALAHLGILGLTIPTAHGGLGLPQYTYCRIIETIARRCASTALFVNAHQSIGLRAILLFGTAAQKERWLPQLASGELIAAFSLTEPNAGSDASAVETQAIWDSERQGWRLNGRKQWTTNGSIAQVLTVMAKTAVDTPRGVEQKVSAFLVTPDMPGFSVTAHALEKVGMRGTKTANLALNDVFVPQDHLLGPLGAGLRVCLTVLDFGRTAFGASCTGAAKMLVEDALTHAVNRYQFRRPLASFPLVKKKLASMSALTYAMHATTYLTAALIDSGREDFMLEAALLKVFVSESLWHIVYETMQVFGGRSFFCEVPYERMMRDARLNMIGEGANEVLRAFIALVGMREEGQQLKELLGAWRAWPPPWKMSFQLIKQHLLAPKWELIHPQLVALAKQLMSAISRFGRAIVGLLARYRENVVEQQLALDRIATIAIALYSSSAVLSSLDHTIRHNSKGVAGCQADFCAGTYYCRLAMQQIQQAFKELYSPLDKYTMCTSESLVSLRSNPSV